jgi:hypothetical protein
MMSNPKDRLIGYSLKTYDTVERIPSIRENTIKFLQDNKVKLLNCLKWKIDGEFRDVNPGKKVVKEIISFINDNETEVVDFVIVIVAEFQ